jgi:hypothetical protein
MAAARAALVLDEPALLPPDGEDPAFAAAPDETADPDLPPAGDRPRPRPQPPADMAPPAPPLVLAESTPPRPVEIDRLPRRLRAHRDEVQALRDLLAEAP